MAPAHYWLLAWGTEGNREEIQGTYGSTVPQLVSLSKLHFAVPWHSLYRVFLSLCFKCLRDTWVDVQRVKKGMGGPNGNVSNERDLVREDAHFRAFFGAISAFSSKIFNKLALDCHDYD